MPTYFLPGDIVTIKTNDQSETMLIAELADALIVPVNRFYMDKDGLRNPYYDGDESDMYWDLKRKIDLSMTHYFGLNRELNQKIIAGDAELLRLTYAPPYELILNAIETWTKIKRQSRTIHAEDGNLFIPKRDSDGYLTWPIKAIREAEFDYWWKNVGSLETDDERAVRDLVYAPHPK